ncbi:hypothetical protein GGR92_005247 [Spirosoma lacussanchae]|uniref:hypothetical protein n=1 Tax=Spirosoma lacussanchae TaxID=1884249 RepID=UPI00110A0514|nr:hypothetical protein [Spirosoma lacussanchae]
MAKQTAAESTLLPYQKVSELTGEVVDKFKYLEGHPRQYRFDGKAGVFNINGDQVIGKTLSFQPIAWRIFTDNILGMGTKNWAELFFVDAKNCVSAILFHGYSVDELFRLIEPLYYEDLTLADVVLTATAEKKTRSVDNGTWFMATFSYAMADPEQTKVFKQFAQETKIFRQETLTDVANIKSAMHYYNPFAVSEEPELPPAGVTRRELNAAVEDHYTADEAA